MKTSSLLNLARCSYEKLIAIAGYAKSPLLLAIRLYWGYQFFITGKGKLEDLPTTIENFRDNFHLPLPEINAVLAGCTECFGGLLLLAGLASRLTAIPLIFTMVVAYMTVHIDTVKGISEDPDAFVSAPPFLFLFAALLVLVLGPGVFSIDHLLARKLRAKPATTPVTA